MNHFEELMYLVESGSATISDLVKLFSNFYVDGKIDREMFASGMNYFKLLDKVMTAKRENRMINIEELINCGIYSSFEEIKNAANERNLGDAFHSNAIISPEPTQDEIEQIYESEDISKVCIICSHRKRHVVNNPCGHSAMCSVCSKIYVKSKKYENAVVCIICNKEVISIIRLYMP